MANFGIKAVALGMALLLGACTTTDGDTARTPAEQKMREQANTFNQTIGEGALAGCIAGAIIGILASSRHKGGGAAIGCGAGAAVGGATGYMVASKQETYANEEARLNAMIDELRADNQRLSGLIESSHTVIESDKAALAALDKKIAANTITQSQAKAELAKVDDNIKYLQQTVANLKKREAEYQTARDEAAAKASAQKTAEVDAQIATLKNQIASLETDLDGLVTRRKISRVG
jgi:archaellum component FlaC